MFRSLHSVRSSVTNMQLSGEIIRRYKHNKHFWKKQQKLLTELGYTVDADPSNPDTLHAMEDAESLEDFQSIYSNQSLEMKEMALRNEVNMRKKIKMKIIQRKFFKEPPERNLLTWKAKEQLRYLHQEDPEKWTAKNLSKSFPVSEKGVIKLLKSSWEPKSMAEVISHDERVQTNWLTLKQNNVSGLLEHSNETLIENFGKLQLLSNAMGIKQLPMPNTKSFGNETKNRNRKVGPFESLVKDYYELQNNIKGKTPNLLVQAKFEYVPRQEKNLEEKQLAVLNDIVNHVSTLEKMDEQLPDENDESESVLSELSVLPPTNSRVRDDRMSMFDSYLQSGNPERLHGPQSDDIENSSNSHSTFDVTEADLAMVGTGKISSKGSSYIEVMKQKQKEDIAKSSQNARVGAYGYFKEDTADHVTNGSFDRKQFNEVNHNKRMEENQQVWSKGKFKFEHEYGRQKDTKQKKTKDQYSKVVHGTETLHYDENGEFLFKTFNSEN